MKRVAFFAILLLFATRSQAALHPYALKVGDLSEQGIGQAVRITIDDSDSAREIEVHFFGNLKPTDEQGDVFISNSNHTIVGFNARPATENTHIYLFRESSGMIEAFLDCNTLLANKLKTKYTDLDSNSFILTSIAGEIATIQYQTHMRTGSFTVEVSLSRNSLEIVKFGKMDE